MFFGDAAYATLPYLASGAGISLEDAAGLCKCVFGISSKCGISLALSVYEICRKKRTTEEMQRSNIQQGLYNLHYGLERRQQLLVLTCYRGVTHDFWAVIYSFASKYRKWF